MKPIGKVNFVGVLMLLGIAAGLYWLILFGPLYIDNLDVKQAVREAWNSWRSVGEEGIKADVIRKLGDSKFGTHPVENPETGEITDVPGLPIDPDNVTVEFDTVRRHLSIRVEYARTVTLVPTDKKRTIHFVVEKSGNPDK